MKIQIEDVTTTSLTTSVSALELKSTATGRVVVTIIGNVNMPEDEWYSDSITVDISELEAAVEALAK